MKRLTSMLSGKRGEAEEMVEQIPYIILTILVLVGVYALMSYASNPKIELHELQAEVFAYRTLYAPNSISYNNTITGRVYPGIIDDAKFTSATLDASMKYDYERQVSAKLEISLSDDPVVIRTAYYNQQWYERLEPIARNRIGGSGGAKILEKTMPIVLRQSGADFPAILKFTIIVPEE